MQPKSGISRHVKTFLNVVVVCVLLFFMYENYQRQNELCARGTHVGQVRSLSFALHALDTPLGRQQGLSGKPNLAIDEGELFVFDAPAEIGFWMKDMLFPIDIIFLDGEYRVVGLVTDAQPESYPKIFMSPKTMRYTIEVSSGTITRAGIAIGETVKVNECPSNEAY